MIPIIKLCLGPEEQAAVAAVLDCHQVAQGARVAEFEARFAEFCGVRYAVATTSGTTALWLALLAHGIGPGDEVITTPFSFIATANAILYTGAKQVFVDIDPDTYNLDPAQVAERITPQTKAILPVHLYGLPAPMYSLLHLAREHNLAIIEDACQAHGAGIGGRRVGSFGTGCFSFYATKNMTTGEGGMLTTNDSAVAEKARLLRAHGMPQRYHHTMLGFNFRMTDIQAAIGLVQLDRLEEFTKQRQANAAFYREALGGLEGLALPAWDPTYEHVFHQFTVRIRSDRDEFRSRMLAKEVGTEVYYPATIYNQPFFRDLGYNDYLPAAEAASREVISLPVYPSLTAGERDQVAEAVIDSLREMGYGSVARPDGVWEPIESVPLFPVIAAAEREGIQSAVAEVASAD